MGAAKSISAALSTKNAEGRYLLTEEELRQEEEAGKVQKKSIKFCIENLFAGTEVKITPVALPGTHIKSALVRPKDEDELVDELFSGQPWRLGQPESCVIDPQGDIIVIPRRRSSHTPAPSPKHAASAKGGGTATPTAAGGREEAKKGEADESTAGGQRTIRIKASELEEGAPPAPPAPECVEATAESLAVEWSLGPAVRGDHDEEQEVDHDAAAMVHLISRYEVAFKPAGDRYTWKVLAGINVLRGERRLAKADSLRPAAWYEFRVRGRNVCDWSQWSTVARFKTEPAAPGAPEPPFSGMIRPHAINLHWRKPAVDNGSRVTSFIVRVRHEAYDPTKPVSEDNASRTAGDWRVVYTGPLERYLATGLEARQFYAFAVAAVNAAGPGPFGRAAAFRTPSSHDADDGYAGPENAVRLRAGDMWLECWDLEQQCVFYYNRATGGRESEAPPAFQALTKRRKSMRHLDDDEAAAETDRETIFRLKRFQFLKDLKKGASSKRVRTATAASRNAATAAAAASSSSSQRANLAVRRANLVADSLTQMGRLTVGALKNRLYVEFEGEAGIDSGGLTKDWFVSFSRGLRAPGSVFFGTTPREDLEVLPLPPDLEGPKVSLDDWRSIGRFVGKAICDGYCADLPLASPVYAALRAGTGPTMEDGDDPNNDTWRNGRLLDDLLAEVDAVEPALASSLRWVLSNDIGASGDVLSATFSVDHHGAELDLVRDGKNVAVTEGNKLEYVFLATRWRARDRTALEMDSFVSGAQDMGLTTDLLSPFTDLELGLLLNGRRTIDVDELTAHATYQGDHFDERHNVAIWFWQLMHEFDPDQRIKALCFVTGTSKIPLDGYSPPFTLTLDPLRESADSLPRAHTCFNQIVLPRYSSYATFAKQVHFAIVNTDSFELT